MEIHDLKILPNYFDLVYDGKKHFEWRKNDRNFEEGDLLYLREWDKESQEYTGRYQLAEVLGVYADPSIGMPIGYVIMEIRNVKLELA